MRIEKKYYTEETRLWRKAEEKEQRWEKSATEGEKAQRDLLSHIEAEKIINKMQEAQKDSYQIIYRQRVERFKILGEKALVLAEQAPMDIIVETETLFGRIVMTADSLMIMESSPVFMRTDFAALIEESESISVLPAADGMIEFTFIYPFYTEIRKEYQTQS
ncbi:MAG: hypothetical protein LUG93_13210 [Lachnospiraceae bacterium]|nr:hypothetical protein [Lachnospiraceae bacterium]